jgi:hypothetical protein
MISARLECAPEPWLIASVFRHDIGAGIMAGDAGIAATEKLKVFISYSRRDAADFADELVAGLELAGLAPFIDRQDIKPGEPWEDRLGASLCSPIRSCS